MNKILKTTLFLTFEKKFLQGLKDSYINSYWNTEQIERMQVKHSWAHMRQVLTEKLFS